MGLKTLLWVFMAWVLLLSANLAHASETNDLALLAPIDTSSPRSTLEGFISSGDRLADLIQARNFSVRPVGESKRIADGELEKLAVDLTNQAATAVDLASVPPLIVERSKIERVLMLFEVLRKVDRRVLDQAPADGSASSWLVPGTPIRIQRVAEGDRKGEYLFADETIQGLEDAYARASLRRSLWGNQPDSYAIFTANLGQIAPTFLKEIVDDLPLVLKSRHGGNAVWQWISATAIVLAGILVTLGSFLGLRRVRVNNQFGKLLILGIPILVARIAAFLSLQAINLLHLSEEAYWLSSAVFLTIAYIAWVIWLVIVTAWLSRNVPQYLYPSDTVKAAILRLSVRFVGVVATGLVIARGLELIGVPLLGILAGLGVGGLALALAAQPTAENLIAGIILFVDRPARVGDECEFEGFRGVVEEIGIRSTSIRLIDGSVITLTNSEFSNMKIRNLGAGRHSFSLEFPIISETKAENIRKFLLDVERYLESDSAIKKGKSSVNIECISASGINVKIFGQYEDINDEFYSWNNMQISILEIIQKNGINIANNFN